METKVTARADNRIVMEVTGRLDADTASVFHARIAEIPMDAQKVILDFADVSYVSSAGLRELLLTSIRFGEKNVQIINVIPNVYEIFEITGFDQILHIEKADEDVASYVKKSIKALIQEKAAAAPDQIVLKGEHADYNWRMIDRMTQIIAGDLAKLGVKKGSHVGICGINSLNWILTYYAVQKLGAIAMLVNPTLNAHEIGTIAAQGDITVFCYGKLREMKGDREVFLSEIKKAPGSQITAFYPFGSEIQFETRIMEYPLVEGRFDYEVDYDSPCTVIFTSGSTARAKGVILSAFNLLNAAQGQIISQRIIPEDKMLLILPLFHVFGLTACLIPSAMTGSVLYIPDNIHIGTLIRVMQKEHCTIMHSVPTLLIALLSNPGFDPDAFSSIRLTAVGGAAATETQMKMFREKMPHNHFKSGYGLSEFMPVTSTEYEDTEDHILHTVGKPVRNVELKIVNYETGTPCTVGESGEILVRGTNLMMGYYKLPITEQSMDEEGWLHTGDLGFQDEEGYVHLSGRLKELIIRGGENIMPGLVEQAVSALEGVDQVKVVGVPDAFYGEAVCACVKLKANAVFDAEQQRNVLKGKLAAHMIPKYFLIFDSFPALGSGKVDAVQLKKMAVQQVSSVQEA